MFSLKSIPRLLDISGFKVLVPCRIIIAIHEKVEENGIGWDYYSISNERLRRVNTVQRTMNAESMMFERASTPLCRVIKYY
jgi:hypothetical protein